MPTWDELFRQHRIQEIFEEPDKRIVEFVDRHGDTRRALDLGCGTGRHTICLAERGLQVVASDLSREGLRLTAAVLAQKGLSALLICNDMAALPFKPGTFDLVLSVHTLYHQTIKGMQRSMAQIEEAMAPGAAGLLTFNSTETDSCGHGAEIEPFTFVPDSGDEAGVPHHYLDEPRLLELLRPFRIADLELAREDMEYETGTNKCLVKEHHAHWWVTLEKE
jgi:SAM-dependent methyltransferase